MKNIKQKLGLEYSQNNPISFIISIRLAQILTYKGADSIRKRHMDNLELTYGKQKVEEVYKLIYGKKVA
jgi:hypothetical protein